MAKARQARSPNPRPDRRVATRSAAASRAWLASNGTTTLATALHCRPRLIDGDAKVGQFRYRLG